MTAYRVLRKNVIEFKLYIHNVVDLKLLVLQGFSLLGWMILPVLSLEENNQPPATLI